MNQFQLRAVMPGDKHQWAALWRDYLAFYRTEKPSDVYDAAFAQLMSGGSDTFSGLLAWLEGTAVGLVHWVVHPHLWRPEGIVYLQDLYVAPAARGTGVGRALIEAVYADADARGVPDVYWLTQDDNPARALYDRVATRTNFVKYQR
ncbi:GNAT family N-acetyltransferase [Jannaschia aquimarina]|uniref:Acetyltransferase (GNAT) family protein n=1 Tax=Jannaschia aquimarina TaxID=935700 RepID=A0A0D1CMZ5_9RHOB|nr:GNAT family N-acetyltransferase [Jannaschia aquimarina]KIT16152.1 Acetyltransferase (GNAT) family protein [Jannaschia aquimarina]SNT37081.1 Acetyltransferase (GNAT) family protein [Jannaschia aquimarina]